MSADLTFLEEIILSLDYNSLIWAKSRIDRRIRSMNPKIVERKTIIRKE